MSHFIYTVLIQILVSILSYIISLCVTQSNLKGCREQIRASQIAPQEPF